LNRASAKRGPSHKREQAERQPRAGEPRREIPLPLDRDELLALMQDSLETLAIEMGLLVAAGLLEDEVTRLCGRRYERGPTGPTATAISGHRDAGRSEDRHRPSTRARTDGGAEVPRIPTLVCSAPTPCPGPCCAAWSVV
jgi:hypothetical protein